MSSYTAPVPVKTLYTTELCCNNCVDDRHLATINGAYITLVPPKRRGGGVHSQHLLRQSLHSIITQGWLLHRSEARAGQVI